MMQFVKVVSVFAGSVLGLRSYQTHPYYQEAPQVEATINAVTSPLMAKYEGIHVAFGQCLTTLNANYEYTRDPIGIDVRLRGLTETEWGLLGPAIFSDLTNNWLSADQQVHKRQMVKQLLLDSFLYCLMKCPENGRSIVSTFLRGHTAGVQGSQFIIPELYDGYLLTPEKRFLLNFSSRTEADIYTINMRNLLDGSFDAQARFHYQTVLTCLTENGLGPQR